MVFYWSDERLEPSDVTALAKKLDHVDHVLLTDDKEYIGSFGKSASGQAYNNIVAEYITLILIVSWDALRESRLVDSEVDTIENWLYKWERAKFKWIQLDALNAGEPLAVALTQSPIRSRINDRDDQREFEYDLVSEGVTVYE